MMSLFLIVLQSNLSLRPPENCGHTISVPSIRGFKCTDSVLENATTWEMRIADTKGRPKASIQPEKSDHIRQIERKALFSSSNFSFVGTPNEQSPRLQAPLVMVVAITPPLTRGSHRSLMAWLAQGHVYNSILKNFEPNLANETTWETGPLTPSPFGGRNSQVWL